VVTGSASLNVFVPGEEDPVNARVLGVSECSDLAVIDLDGEGYPFLEWYDGELDTGLEVFAAGYPQGEPEFTLTDGIISRGDYDVDTGWASVDNVLSHSARINPGNSGGPLLTQDAQVVGVNYAGDPETDENLAISVTDAEELVEQLRDEEDDTFIGVNGVAVADEESGDSGVWVSSVASGSPADNAGVASGDMITRLENVTIGEEGTMAGYCDILRSRSADDVLRIEVLRFDSEEILEGQLNGDELVQVTSFAQELEGTTGAAPAGEAAYEYTSVTDDTGALQVEVPTQWSDVDGAPTTDSAGRYVADVRAAPDLVGLQERWDTPGVIFSASSAIAQQANETTLLDELQANLSSQCTYDGRQPYEDPLYSGQYDLYTDCGGVGATFVVVGAVPEDRAYVIRVAIQANADRDFEALDRILNTFVVTGEV
jgi:serine protease Do